MQLVAKIKLNTSTEQFNSLKKTLKICNECCNWISSVAWDAKKFGQFSIHKIAYYGARNQFPDMGSSAIIDCESKVSQSYKANKKTKHKFIPLGAIKYNCNGLRWRFDKKEVSIWSVDGRLHIGYSQGKIEPFDVMIGDSDLVLVGNRFYLFVPYFVETATEQDVADVLGVDLGIVNLASDSDGESFGGESVEENRRKFTHRRRNLQRKGTKSAKRKLKKISGKQSRFQKDTNHVISKRIVKKAQDTSRGIGLEDLTGIGNRTTARRSQRARLANWSFYDLRTKIEYKAKIAGVPVFHVSPKYTSQQCSSCGSISKQNRPNQSTFKCQSCGHAENADTNAARNIRARAASNLPMAARV